MSRLKKRSLATLHQAVDVEPGVVPADGGLGVWTAAGFPAGRGARRRRQSAPDVLAERHAGDQRRGSESARCTLIPRVAGQPLVGPFAGQGDLVAACVDLARPAGAGGARRVDDRRLGGADQLGVGGRAPRAGRTRRRSGRAPTWRRHVRPPRVSSSAGVCDADGERRDRPRRGAWLAIATTRLESTPPRQVRDDRHVGPQAALDGGVAASLEIGRSTVAASASGLSVPAVGEVDLPVGRSSMAVARLAAVPSWMREIVARLQQCWTPSKHVTGPGHREERERRG